MGGEGEWVGARVGEGGGGVAAGWVEVCSDGLERRGRCAPGTGLPRQHWAAPPQTARPNKTMVVASFDAPSPYPPSMRAADAAFFI